MTDSDCVEFLQWALPRLKMRWPGFRKVRKQVGKRIRRRMRDLKLNGLSDYRCYLETHADEWARLDEICRITISRFYRDKGVFDELRDTVLVTKTGNEVLTDAVPKTVSDIEALMA